MLLGLERRPVADAADALAVALCHAQSRRLAALSASIWRRALARAAQPAGAHRRAAMIGSLAGVLAPRRRRALLLEVGGVGYEIEAPMSTFYSLPAVGQPVRLLTHLVVREDAQLLYGFAHRGGAALFRSLLKVSGVGPRIALAILSGVTAEAFAHACTREDAATLTRIPGRRPQDRRAPDRRDARPARRRSRPTAHAAPWPPRRSGAAGRGLQRAGRARLQAGGGHAAAQGGRHRGGSTEELIRRALQGAARE